MSIRPFAFFLLVWVLAVLIATPITLFLDLPPLLSFLNGMLWGFIVWVSLFDIIDPFKDN